MSTEHSTEEMIRQLSEHVQEVRTISYGRVCAEWLLVVIANIVLTTWMYGLRPDMHERMVEPFYVAELLLNAMLIVVVGALATASAYPDRARGNGLRVALLVGFIGYSVLVGYVSARDAFSFQETFAHVHMGWACTGCILHFALVPAVYVAWRLRKLAPLQPVFTGFATLMLAGLVGTLGVRLVIPHLDSVELIFFHYLPLLLLCGAGLLIGKRVFTW